MKLSKFNNLSVQLSDQQLELILRGGNSLSNISSWIAKNKLVSVLSALLVTSAGVIMALSLQNMKVKMAYSASKVSALEQENVRLKQFETSVTEEFNRLRLMFRQNEDGKGNIGPLDQLNPSTLIPVMEGYPGTWGYGIAPARDSSRRSSLQFK